MYNPLVSVIVLSFNQAPFLKAAVESVVHQDYPQVEIIGIDDGSIDGSGALFEELSLKYSFSFFQNPANLGNCRSFNKALGKANGNYIIDLAGDDILLPGRISKGVEVLEGLPKNFGIHFCDAQIIDEEGAVIKTHYPRDENGNLMERVAEGWVFKELLERYFICTPSMMMRKEVMDQLGGYDEELSYEDFDFWVRSSRNWQYAFSDEVLVQKRSVKKSHSQGQKKIFNRQIRSTRIVCEKALVLCKSRDEYKALVSRINYEMKWAFATGNLREWWRFVCLKKEIKKILDS